MKANDTHLSLPAQQVSIDVLLEKYAKGGEKTIERRAPAGGASAGGGGEGPGQMGAGVSTRRWKTDSFPAGASIPRPARSCRPR